MKLRTQKKKLIGRMENMPFDLDTNKMYITRYTKPCASYTPWCSDCNAVLFKQSLGRFPYTIEEFNSFEEVQQCNDATVDTGGTGYFSKSPKLCSPRGKAEDSEVTRMLQRALA